MLCVTVKMITCMKQLSQCFSCTMLSFLFTYTLSPCRINGSLACTCGSELVSDLPASHTIILTRNNTYLRFTQSAAGHFSSAIFEALLNDKIVFNHGLVRPDMAVPYDVSVSVSINDGMFTSNTATATITVHVINISPSVLLDGNVSMCDVPPLCNTSYYLVYVWLGHV